LARIGTASTRRAIDKWKRRAKANASRSYSSGLALAGRLLVKPSLGRLLLVPPLALVLSMNFAAIELPIFIIIGFFMAKLNFYRLVNSAASLFSIQGK
jgi:hypothetical protein